jgi:heme peroxidase/type IX secretion system substrate protein
MNNIVTSTKHIVVALFAFAMTLQVSAQELRSLDGRGNNLSNVDWGASYTQVGAITTPAYADGISEPAGSERPNPRLISNVIFSQSGRINDQLTLSDYVWVFGQFVDHDIILSNNDLTEPIFIEIPSGDPDMDPLGTGQVVMPIFRSEYDPATGTDVNNPRRHVNAITAFIDGSGIYGVNFQRSMWLRTFEGGKLRTSEGNLLPFNTRTGEFNAPRDALAPYMADDVRISTRLFIAGDIRANENSLLTAFHTLFVREHNRLCEIYQQKHPSWDDERIYQKSRRVVIGLLQSIVFDEWLPAMGVEIEEYSGYDPAADPAISNIFAAAAFRLGHTLLNSEIVRMDNDGKVIPQGNLALKDAYFNPKEILLAGGLDPYFKGMGTQIQQNLDCKIVDDVRNFLFGEPGDGGLDLAAINIMRGRERGLGDFNSIRRDLGFEPLSELSGMCAIPDLAIDLESVYASVDDVDPWVGMLAEEHMPKASFGETIMYIIKDQFTRLRDGDRFFYKIDPGLTEFDIEEIKATKFSDIIRRNTGIALMQENVFFAKEHDLIPFAKAQISSTNLDIALFPNPVLTTVNIKTYVASEGNAVLRVFDMQGRLVMQVDYVFTQGINTLSFNVDNQLLPGVYAVQLEKDGAYNTIRMVKH